MTQVEVRSKIPGNSGAFDVLVDVPAPVVTAADLIKITVEEQVRLLGEDVPRCRDLLDRQYLSAADIRDQAAAGAVRMPARHDKPVDAAAEVTRAHRAFQRRTFAVFAGGRQLERLDDEVRPEPGGRIVFIRLTPLAGG